MAVQRRYASAMPTTGIATYDGGGSNYIPLHSFLEYSYDPTDDAATVLVSDWLLTFSEIAEESSGLKLVNLEPYIIGGVPDANDANGNAYLEVYTGAGKTGTKFDVILQDTEFSTLPSKLEVRAEIRTGRLSFSTAQLAAEGATVAYITFRASHSATTAWWRSMIEQEIKATQLQVDAASGATTNLAETITATAGAAIPATTFFYIDTNGLAQPLTDPSDKDQMLSVAYAVAAFTLGSTVTGYLQGKVAVSSGSVGTLPIAKDITVGNNAFPTWHGDASGNALTTGDHVHFAGRSYDGVSLWMNLTVPLSVEAR